MYIYIYIYIIYKEKFTEINGNLRKKKEFFSIVHLWTVFEGI